MMMKFYGNTFFKSLKVTHTYTQFQIYNKHNSTSFTQQLIGHPLPISHSSLETPMTRLWNWLWTPKEEEEEEEEHSQDLHTTPVETKVTGSPPPTSPSPSPPPPLSLPCLLPSSSFLTFPFTSQSSTTTTTKEEEEEGGGGRRREEEGGGGRTSLV